MKRLLSLFLLCVLATGLTTDAMKQATTEQLKECLYCGDEKRENEFSTLTTCHPEDSTMCLKCCRTNIKNNLNTKNDDGVLMPEEPHCPHRGCMNIINQDIVQVILKDKYELRERYNDFLFEKLKRKEGIKPCPHPDCNAEFESQIGEQSHQCPSCHQHYCPTCEFDHRGMTCQQAGAMEHNCTDCNTRHARNVTCDEAKRVSSQNIGDTERKELQEKNRQKCPKCKVMLEKIDGCNYMRCGNPGCGYEFCWLCLGPGQNHRCVNNNCGIFNPDHQALADQIANIERQMVGANFFTRQRLEQQKAQIEAQRNRIEAQRLRTEQQMRGQEAQWQAERQAREAQEEQQRVAREAFLAADRKERAERILEVRKTLTGCMFVTAGATSIAVMLYQTWNQKRKLDLIAQTAEQNVATMLAIEFDLFDENSSLLTLQEQFDIDAMLKIVKSDAKRHTFKSAIEAYDASFQVVRYKILSPKYCHQTPEYFLKNEPDLVQKLYADLDALKEAASSSRSDISLSWTKLFGMSGLFACAAAGGAWYGFDV